MTTLVVLAKECLPGRVKTRLHPAFSFEEAAELAAASLADTLDAASRVRADRHLLWFDGVAPAGTGFEVLPQPAGDLAERIGAAFDATEGRTVLIGMDTPQVDPAVLQAVLDEHRLDEHRVEGDPLHDAWLGLAADGGYWALGLDALPGRRRGDLVRGVPMSTGYTGEAQLARLLGAGLRVRRLPRLTDVDTAATAEEVAAAAPATRFATALRAARRPLADVAA